MEEENKGNDLKTGEKNENQLEKQVELKKRKFEKEAQELEAVDFHRAVSQGRLEVRKNI